MQDIAFALGHFLEWTFKLIIPLGWLPVAATSLLLFFGFVYWLVLQGRYNRKAKSEGTLV